MFEVNRGWDEITLPVIKRLVGFFHNIYIQSKLFKPKKPGTRLAEVAVQVQPQRHDRGIPEIARQPTCTHNTPASQSEVEQEKGNDIHLEEVWLFPVIQVSHSYGLKLDLCPA